MAARRDTKTAAHRMGLDYAEKAHIDAVETPRRPGDYAPTAGDWHAFRKVFPGAPAEDRVAFEHAYRTHLRALVEG